MALRRKQPVLTVAALQKMIHELQPFPVPGLKTDHITKEQHVFLCSFINTLGGPQAPSSLSAIGVDDAVTALGFIYAVGASLCPYLKPAERSSTPLSSLTLTKASWDGSQADGEAATSLLTTHIRVDEVAREVLVAVRSALSAAAADPSVGSLVDARAVLNSLCTVLDAFQAVSSDACQPLLPVFNALLASCTIPHLVYQISKESLYTIAPISMDDQSPQVGHWVLTLIQALPTGLLAKSADSVSLAGSGFSSFLISLALSTSGLMRRTRSPEMLRRAVILIDTAMALTTVAGDSPNPSSSAPSICEDTDWGLLWRDVFRALFTDQKELSGLVTMTLRHISRILASAENGSSVMSLIVSAWVQARVECIQVGNPLAPQIHMPSVVRSLSELVNAVTAVFCQRKTGVVVPAPVAALAILRSPGYHAEPLIDCDSVCDTAVIVIETVLDCLLQVEEEEMPYLLQMLAPVLLCGSSSAGRLRSECQAVSCCGSEPASFSPRYQRYSPDSAPETGINTSQAFDSLLAGSRLVLQPEHSVTRVITAFLQDGYSRALNNDEIQGSKLQCLLKHFSELINSQDQQSLIFDAFFSSAAVETILRLFVARWQLLQSNPDLFAQSFDVILSLLGKGREFGFQLQDSRGTLLWDTMAALSDASMVLEQPYDLMLADLAEAISSCCPMTQIADVPAQLSELLLSVSTDEELEAASLITARAILLFSSPMQLHVNLADQLVMAFQVETNPQYTTRIHGLLLLLLSIWARVSSHPIPDLGDLPSDGLLWPAVWSSLSPQVCLRQALFNDGERSTISGHLLLKTLFSPPDSESTSLFSMFLPAPTPVIAALRSAFPSPPSSPEAITTVANDAQNFSSLLRTYPAVIFSRVDLFSAVFDKWQSTLASPGSREDACAVWKCLLFLCSTPQRAFRLMRFVLSPSGASSFSVQTPSFVSELQQQVVVTSRCADGARQILEPNFQQQVMPLRSSFPLPLQKSLLQSSLCIVLRLPECSGELVFENTHQTRLIRLGFEMVGGGMRVAASFSDTELTLETIQSSTYLTLCLVIDVVRRPASAPKVGLGLGMKAGDEEPQLTWQKVGKPVTVNDCNFTINCPQFMGLGIYTAPGFGLALSNDAESGLFRRILSNQSVLYDPPSELTCLTLLTAGAAQYVQPMELDKYMAEPSTALLGQLLTQRSKQPGVLIIPSQSHAWGGLLTCSAPAHQLNGWQPAVTRPPVFYALLGSDTFNCFLTFLATANDEQTLAVGLSMLYQAKGAGNYFFDLATYHLRCRAIELLNNAKGGLEHSAIPSIVSGYVGLAPVRALPSVLRFWSGSLSEPELALAMSQALVGRAQHDSSFISILNNFGLLSVLCCHLWNSRDAEDSPFIQNLLLLLEYSTEGVSAAMSSQLCTPLLMALSGSNPHRAAQVAEVLCVSMLRRSPDAQRVTPEKSSRAVVKYSSLLDLLSSHIIPELFLPCYIMASVLVFSSPTPCQHFASIVTARAPLYGNVAPLLWRQAQCVSPVAGLTIIPEISRTPHLSEFMDGWEVYSVTANVQFRDPNALTALFAMMRRQMVDSGKTLTNFPLLDTLEHLQPSTVDSLIALGAVSQLGITLGQIGTLNSRLADRIIQIVVSFLTNRDDLASVFEEFTQAMPASDSLSVEASARVAVGLLSHFSAQGKAPTVQIIDVLGMSILDVAHSGATTPWSGALYLLIDLLRSSSSPSICSALAELISSLLVWVLEHADIALAEAAASVLAAHYDIILAHAPRCFVVALLSELMPLALGEISRPVTELADPALVPPPSRESSQSLRHLALRCICSVVELDRHLLLSLVNLLNGTGDVVTSTINTIKLPQPVSNSALVTIPHFPDDIIIDSPEYKEIEASVCQLFNELGSPFYRVCVAITTDMSAACLKRQIEANSQFSRRLGRRYADAITLTQFLVKANDNCSSDIRSSRSAIAALSDTLQRTVETANVASKALWSRIVYNITLPGALAGPALHEPLSPLSHEAAHEDNAGIPRSGNYSRVTAPPVVISALPASLPDMSGLLIEYATNESSEHLPDITHSVLNTLSTRDPQTPINLGEFVDGVLGVWAVSRSIGRLEQEPGAFAIGTQGVVFLPGVSPDGGQLDQSPALSCPMPLTPQLGLAATGFCPHVAEIEGFFKDIENGVPGADTQWMRPMTPQASLIPLPEGSTQPHKRFSAPLHNAIFVPWSEITHVNRSMFGTHSGVFTIHLQSAPPLRFLCLDSELVCGSAAVCQYLASLPPPQGAAAARDLIAGTISKAIRSKKVPTLTRAEEDLNDLLQQRLRRSTQDWCDGKITNMTYLMILNELSGRSTADPYSWPVAPWVLSDYQSVTLDLSSPEYYRCLDISMPGMGKERLEQLEKRWATGMEMAGYESSDGDQWPRRRRSHASNDEQPQIPGLVPTHYSSACIVLLMAMRLEPFIEEHVAFQSGRIDHADRLFTDLGNAWLNASSTCIQDYRELLPALFSTPELYLNINQLDLGCCADGTAVGDVGLPLWASRSAVQLTLLMRRALESPEVTQSLHHWIDLIFGYKQRGESALKSNNLFEATSYPQTTNDPALHAVSLLCGVCPQQLFTTAHPARTLLYPAQEPSAWYQMSDFLSESLVEPKQLQQPGVIVVQNGVNPITIESCGSLIVCTQFGKSRTARTVAPVSALTYSSDEAAVFFGLSNGDIFVLDPSTMETRALPRLLSQITALSVRKGGGLLLAGDQSGTISLILTGNSYRQLIRLHLLRSSCVSVSFAAREQFILAASPDEIALLTLGGTIIMRVSLTDVVENLPLGPIICVADCGAPSYLESRFILTGHATCLALWQLTPIPSSSSGQFSLTPTRQFRVSSPVSAITISSDLTQFSATLLDGSILHVAPVIPSPPFHPSQSSSNICSQCQDEIGTLSGRASCSLCGSALCMKSKCSVKCVLPRHGITKYDRICISCMKSVGFREIRRYCGQTPG